VAESHPLWPGHPHLDIFGAGSNWISAEELDQSHDTPGKTLLDVPRSATPQPERSFSFDMEALELEEEDDEAKEQNEDGSSLDGKDQLFFDQKWRLGLRLMFFGLI
jgi:hypothetical protein